MADSSGCSVPTGASPIRSLDRFLALRESLSNRRWQRETDGWFRARRCAQHRRPQRRLCRPLPCGFQTRLLRRRHPRLRGRCPRGQHRRRHWSRLGHRATPTSQAGRWRLAHRSQRRHRRRSCPVCSPRPRNRRRRRHPAQQSATDCRCSPEDWSWSALACSYRRGRRALHGGTAGTYSDGAETGNNASAVQPNVRQKNLRPD